MLFAGLEPDDVTRANFLDRSSPTLHPAAAAGHDERLAQRVRVPRGARPGLEGHTGTTRACRNRRFEQRVNTHGAGKPLGGPLLESCEPFLLMSIGRFVFFVLVAEMKGRRPALG
jgi:hypothetical protein